jgi:putative endonuclease
MSFWVYIIQSAASGRLYCGQTSDVERRIRQHNDPAYHLSKTTKRFEGPWRLVWFEECISRGEAMKLEERVKKRGVKRFFQDVQPAESRRGGITR